MAGISANDIRTWFEDTFDIAREGGNGHLQHGFNLSKPCQIEVFWMDEPLEGQVFVISHDKDRPDREVLVHGPFGGASFVEEIEEIVDSDRWQEPIPPPRNNKPGLGPPTRADVLANSISRFIEKLEQSIFVEYSSDTIIFGGARLWDDTFSHNFLGNIANYEPEEIFSLYGASSGDEKGEGQKSKQEENSNRSKTGESETVVAGGAYIYKPVWIESAPNHGFSEKVWGHKPFNYDKVYSTGIRDMKLHAYRDGLLLLESEEGETVLKVLNAIFCMGIFHTFRLWRSLKDSEIYSTRLKDGEMRQSSYGLSTPTGRNQLVNPSDRPSDHDRSLLSVDMLDRLVQIVEVIYPIHNVCNRATLHLQAHSHLLEEDYDASFVLNWTVIEQLIDDLLNEIIDEEHGLDWENKGLEFAEITNLISKSEYDLLDEHREKRNNIVHDMDSVSPRESEELDLLVSKLMVRNINDYLIEQDVSPIDYRPDPVKFENRRPEIRRDLASI